MDVRTFLSAGLDARIQKLNPFQIYHLWKLYDLFFSMASFSKQVYEPIFDSETDQGAFVGFMQFCWVQGCLRHTCDCFLMIGGNESYIVFSSIFEYSNEI